MSGQKGRKNNLPHYRHRGRTVQVDIPKPCPLLHVGERKKREPTEVYIQRVPARRDQGSTEAPQFLAKQLRLPQLLYRWQPRKLAYVRKRCGHRSGEAGVVCKSSPGNIQAQHQPLAAQEIASPIALSHGNQGPAAILFLQSAIFNGEGTILCENTGGDSEHSSLQIP